MWLQAQHGLTTGRGPGHLCTTSCCLHAVVSLRGTAEQLLSKLCRGSSALYTNSTVHGSWHSAWACSSSLQVCFSLQQSSHLNIDMSAPKSSSPTRIEKQCFLGKQVAVFVKTSEHTELSRRSCRPLGVPWSSPRFEPSSAVNLLPHVCDHYVAAVARRSEVASQVKEPQAVEACRGTKCCFKHWRFLQQA